MRRSNYEARITCVSAFTLIEVVVVLALVGLVAGISTVAMVSLRPTQRTELVATLDSARSVAIRSGTPIHVVLVLSDTAGSPRTAHWNFLPDGRALGPNLDPMTGATYDAR